MKNLFNPSDAEKLQQRLSEITVISIPSWGKFSPQKMFCHLIDQMEYALAGKDYFPLRKGPPLFIRTIIRKFFPIPKNTPTADVMLKTIPQNFKDEKTRVANLIKTISESKDHKNWSVHPFFGKLYGDEWARLTWRHIDHHLKQFGV